MKLVKTIQKASALEGQLHQKHPHRAFYQDMLEDMDGTKYAFSLSALWSRIAPSGNIYRLNSLHQSRLRHCADLWKQLYALAEKHAGILGGKSSPLEQRCAALLESLKMTKVELFLVGKEAEDAEFGMPVEKTTGFPPLEEFMSDRPVAGFVVWSPEDEAARQTWYTSQLVGSMVCVVQLLGPVLIVFSVWEDSANYMRDPVDTWERLTAADIFCASRNMNDWATILMGVMFSFFVVTQLLNSATADLADATKNGRLLPCDSVWSIIDAFVNAWCVVWNIVALPILFWKMETASQVVLGALGVLFVYTLDDLTGTAGSLLATSDYEFQRGICWHYALLSQCPVRLEDVVNPDATSAKDFWQITLSNTGLLVARDSNAKGPPSELSPTRIAPVAEEANTEETPLADSAKRQSWQADPKGVPSFDQLKVRVRFSETGSAHRLPSCPNIFQVYVWQAIVWILHLLQVLLPPFYFIVNKPCHHHHT